jgi:hypothetical protein
MKNGGELTSSFLQKRIPEGFSMQNQVDNAGGVAIHLAFILAKVTFDEVP